MGVPAAIPASSWLPQKSPCGVWKGLAILTWGGAECLADYTAKVKLNVKVLDFVQLGGPRWTVDRTVFEMWLGAL